MNQESTYSLQELSQLTGLSPRTIRSYIAQDLVRGPVSRGRNARYTEHHLKRLRTICRLKDHYGLSMEEIRQAVMMAGDEDIHIAEVRKGLNPWTAHEENKGAARKDLTEDMASLRQRAKWQRQRFEEDGEEPPDERPGVCYDRAPRPDASPQPEVCCGMDAPPPSPPVVKSEILRKMGLSFESGKTPSPVERLLLRLQGGPRTQRGPEPHPGPDRPPPAGSAAPRVCRGRSWIGIEVTPDVQLSIRGYYDPDQIALFEQVADHMRAILMGGDDIPFLQKEAPTPPSAPDDDDDRDPEAH